MEFCNIIPIFLLASLCTTRLACGTSTSKEDEPEEPSNKYAAAKIMFALREGGSGDPVEETADAADMDMNKREPRFSRFYYCGPKNSSNSCRSLCYAMGYPTHSCGRVSCYCTF